MPKNLSTVAISAGGTLVFCRDYKFKSFQSIEIGPQQASFEFGEKQGHSCFAMYQYDVVDNKALYSYCSFENQQAFIEHIFVPEPSKKPPYESCFFELIRETARVKEYYDLEWTPKSCDRESLLKEESQIFATFLDAIKKVRCQEYLTAANFLVLSASSFDAKKGSLHIIGSTIFQNNFKHLHNFAINGLRPYLMETNNSLEHIIDWGVYTRNRNFRCIGQHKRNDPNRILLPAEWHIASLHANPVDFFVCLPQNNNNDDDLLMDKRWMVSSTAKNRYLGHNHAKYDSYVEKKYEGLLENHMLFETFCLMFQNVFYFVPCGPFAARLVRKKNSNVQDASSNDNCLICRRRHDNENGFLWKNNQNVIMFKCYRENTPIAVNATVFHSITSGETSQKIIKEKDSKKSDLESSPNSDSVSNSELDTTSTLSFTLKTISEKQSVLKAPALNRWDRYISGLITKKCIFSLKSQPSAQDKKECAEIITHHVYCINKTKVLCRNIITGELEIILDQAFAVLVLQKINEFGTQKINLYFTKTQPASSDKKWYIAKNRGPIVGIGFISEATVAVCNIIPPEDNLEEYGQPITKSHKMADFCQIGHIYTALNFSNQKKLYIEIQSDSSEKTWVYINKKEVWAVKIFRHFERGPLSSLYKPLRFIFRGKNTEITLVEL